jgi:phospholipid N-methyltransferase
MTPTHTVESDRPLFLYRVGVVMQAWWKQPAQVASICPSSTVLTHCIADRDCIRNAAKIVDLGPGTGGTTSAILSRASPNSRVLAIEMTSAFIPILKTIDDPRLVIQQGNALRLEHFFTMHRLESPDVILSGIPFSSLPCESATAIVASIHRALRPGGVFIAYQLRNCLREYAKPYFGDPQSTQAVWWNMPPLRVFTWAKQGASGSVTAS